MTTTMPQQATGYLEATWSIRSPETYVSTSNPGYLQTHRDVLA
jgi:hypothetical protein